MGFRVPVKVLPSSRSASRTRAARSGSHGDELDTGPADEKPAVFIHAQIHAMEFTGTTAALHLLDHLLHSGDARVTHALDTRTFYVVPRVNPDGADAGLADGRCRRSSVRPYPRDEPEDGLHREDVDGDGRVLFMRMSDPNGSWKPHPDDARLIVPAGPTTSTATSTASSRRHDPELGRRHDPDRAAARRARPQPQLACRLGAGGRAAGRRPVPDLRARGARPRAGDRRAQEHHRATSATTRSRESISVPGRPPRTTTSPCRPARVRAHRRRGDPHHGLPVDLDLPRLQVPPEDGHQGRRRRLDLRPPRRVRVGDRVLEPAARGRARRLPLHRLDPRALPRGRARRR